MFCDVAVNELRVPAQIGFCDAEIEIDTGRTGVTDMVIELDTAGFPEAQTRLDVRLHVIKSLFSGEYANVGRLAPEGVPLTFQVYWGDVPPLTGMELYVTTVPAHTGFDEVVIETDTGRLGETAMVIVLETATAGLTHTAEEFISTLISSPFAGMYE